MRRRKDRRITCIRWRVSVRLSMAWRAETRCREVRLDGIEECPHAHLTSVPLPVSPARCLPIDWGAIVHAHDDRAIFQGRIDELSVIDIHSL